MNAIEKVLALSRGEAVADDDLMSLTWSKEARAASALARKKHSGDLVHEGKYAGRDDYSVRVRHPGNDNAGYGAVGQTKEGKFSAEAQDHRPGDETPIYKHLGDHDTKEKARDAIVAWHDKGRPGARHQTEQDKAQAVSEPKIIDHNAGLPKSDMRATTKGFKSDSHVAKVKADAVKFRKDNPHLYGPNGEDLQARAKPGEYGYHKIKKGK